MFVFFGGLLVLILVTALVAPSFIEWSNYRSEFEKQAGKVLGQKVQVLGSAKARLLPLPRIEFTNVRVGAREDGEAMMVVDKFRVEAELAPLLKGDIVIVNMDLQSPRVNIAVGDKGVVDWTNRNNSGVNPEDVLLEKVTISDGSIRLHNIATDQSFEAEQINVEISARTLAGPWRIIGDLILKDQKADIKVTTGLLQKSGQINSRLVIKPHSHPYSLELDGPVGLIDGTLRYKGNFKLRAMQIVRAAIGDIPARTFPYAALPIAVSGMFDARPNALKVQEFTLAVGQKDDPYSINGTAQAAFGDRSLFKIVAEGQQIDVDRLGKLSNSPAKRPTLGERFDVLRKIVEQVPVPPADGLISLYLPAVIAGDTVIREVGVDIRPQQNGWRLSNLDAGLPGRTKLQAHGLLTTGEDFGFNGQLLLASKQPSGFAGWLKGNVDEAIRRLPNAGFSAKVVLNSRRILLEKLEIVLGNTRLQGAFERVANTNSRPLLSTILAGNNIDYETLQALFLLFVSDQGGNKISDHDMDIKLLSENFTAHGIKAGSVAASLKLSDGHLSIDQMEIGDLAGAKISATGAFNNALNKPDGGLKLTITANNSKNLLELARKKIGPNSYIDNLLQQPSLLDDLHLEAEVKAVASGSESTLDLVLVGEAGGTGIDASLKLKGDTGQPGKAQSLLQLTLVNATPHLLLSQLAIPVLPLDVEGELKISTRLQGIPEESLDAAFDVTLANANLAGKGEIDWISGQMSGKSMRNRFDLRVTAPDLDSIMLLSGLSFPGIADSGAAELTANLTTLGNFVSLKNIEGTIAGQNIGGKFTLDRAASPRPKIDGKLALQSLSLETIAGLVMGGSAIENGKAWSAAPFTLPTLRGLDGAIEISVMSVDLATSGLGYDQKGKNLTASLELNDGDIAIKDASLDWLGGEVQGEISFAQNQQEVLANTQLTIQGGIVSDLAWKPDQRPLLNGRLDMTVTAEGSGKSISEIIANLVGGGTLSIKNAAIRDLNSVALKDILSAADFIPDDKIEAATGKLVDATLSKEPFVTGQFDTAFSIAGGNIRANNMKAATKLAELTGDIRIDLANLEIDGNARFAFNPGEEALTGAAPEIGFVISGPLAVPQVTRSTDLLASFLTMRVRERKEREYEEQKEKILESQRLTRMVRLQKNRTRARQRVDQQEEDKQRLEEQAMQDQQKLLKELEEAEEVARKARVAVQNKQRQADDKRRQKDKVEKQKQLRAAQELERQKADLKRRQEAFDQLLLEQKKAQTSNSARANAPANTSGRAPKLSAPREVQPIGTPKKSNKRNRGTLPGVFDSVEDEIGNILKNTQ